MPRGARRVSSTGMYHIMIRGIDREEIFKKTKDVRKICGVMREYLSEEIEIYAYCVMPNHLHLLLKGDLPLVTSYMQRLSGAYALYYNLERERSGYVFQGRFRSECVEEERYFWTCLQYIHDNPVKARLAKPGEPYPGCSTWEYQTGKMFLLHEKAFALFGKKGNTQTEDAEIYRIVMDTKEDEKAQKERYFAEKLHRYLDGKRISERDLFTSSQNRKDFADYIVKEKIISKSMVEKRIAEIREKYQ